MKLPALLAAATACCVVLGACRSEEPTEATAPANPVASKEVAPPSPVAPKEFGPAKTYTFRRLIHATLPEFTFTLVGDTADASSETVRVRRIEIHSGKAAEPVQVIGDLETETPTIDARPAFDFVDMNFDGYTDIRLIERQAAGPNTPYLNWLFDPTVRKFVASPELNEIASAQFDSTKREIHSDWRDGATRYGTDVYVYRDGKPVLVRKEERNYQAPGVYTFKRSERVDGTWKTLEERVVREAKGG
jgi:hypothetical protein